MLLMGRMLMLASGHAKGIFSLFMDDNLYNATDQDGFAQSGSLNIHANGTITWEGDNNGIDAPVGDGHRWFLGTILGNWHVKINHLTPPAGNVLTAGSQEDVWRPLSSDVGFTFTRASVGGPDTATSTYDLAFSNDGGATVHANETITIELRELGP